jgi:hypothetical protein
MNSDAARGGTTSMTGSSRKDRMLRGIITIVYVVAGIAVANSHHYFGDLHSLMGILSAVLAVVLWPLILLGVDLHLGLMTTWR